MKRGLVLVLIVLVAACGPSGETSDVTSVPSSDDSTSSVASTRAAASSTTTIASTTTTIASTTTMSDPPTTLLDGNWADQPIVVSGMEGLVLGWWDGSTWISPDPDSVLPASVGNQYQTALLDEHHVITGGPQVEGCDIRPTTLPAVAFDDLALLESETEPALFGVAVSAPWPIYPRPVSSASANAGAAHDEIGRLLAELGMQVEDPRLVQTLESDLDGNGSVETLAVAADTDLTAARGNYSLVILMAASETRLIARSVFPPGSGSEDIPEELRVSAVADLDGDGAMEVVLSGRGLEWVSSAVYDWSPGSDPMRVLDVGCGL